MIGHIYKITNKINGKIYIGQTIQTVKARWYRHCGKKSLSKNEMDMHIKRAILKYGKQNFEVETLEDCDSKFLNDREIYYISYYDSYKHGYNSTLGGQTATKPCKLSEEEQLNIVQIYKKGASLMELGREFNVDPGTIKGVLKRHSVPLRETKTYKFCSEQRQEIVDAANNGISRKELMEKYHISKSYLSQLISGNRRI